MIRAAALVMLATSCLVGCATLQPIAREHGLVLTEGSWQVLHAVDFAQTITIARQPARYQEEGVPTRWLIGEHPSEGAVVACWAGLALAHLAVTRYLADRTDRGRPWRWALYAWEALTLTDSAFGVAQNASIGLQPFGPHGR
jgi:hypothetical protein